MSTEVRFLICYGFEPNNQKVKAALPSLFSHPFTSQSREFLSVSELLLPSALALPPTASIAAVHFPFLTPTTYEDY